MKKKTAIKACCLGTKKFHKGKETIFSRKYPPVRKR